MAKQSSIQKNLNRIKIVSKFEKRRKNLKKKIMQKDLTIEDRFKLQSKLNDLPRDSSRGRVRNRCRLQEDAVVFIENLVFLELNCES